MSYLVPISSDADGRIMTSLSGTYTVETIDGERICKPRGVFRKRGIIPCVGDYVKLGEGDVITEILPRRNVITRPPCANLDQIFFVTSVVEPVPNLYLLDAFMTVALYQDIAVSVVITKGDLADASSLAALYQHAGIDTYVIDYTAKETVDAVAEKLSGRVTMMTGNTGVGKSTLLHAIDPSRDVETNEISHKLGRGKHTTRMVSLYPCAGGYLADTPGFSSFDPELYLQMDKEKIASCFPEFRPYLGKCLFKDCAHIREKGCAIVDAVQCGDIAKSRHASYVTLYQIAKERRTWEN